MSPTEKPPCFIILGRYGDVIQLLPAFQAVKERSGHTPIVIVSTDYASVFDGVSYVQPFPVHWHWWQGVPNARRLAEEQFGGGIVCAWWNETKDRIRLIEQANAGGVVLQSHGNNWGVNIAEWPDYGTSMWDRAGFSREEMMGLPLVFDRRDAGREGVLTRTLPRSGKPLLLVNFRGDSSPFGPHPEVMRVVNEYAGAFNIVDIGKIRCSRIYDLLGLYDLAAGLITIDTATLHLAAARNVEYVAYTVNGWTSSVPKGRVALEVKYSDALGRLPELRPILDRWAGVVRAPAPVNGGGGGGVMAL